MRWLTTSLLAATVAACSSADGGDRPDVFVRHGDASTDAGALRDARVEDAGVRDAAFDAGVFEAGAHEAGASEAGASEAGVADAGTPEAGVRDAGLAADSGVTAAVPGTRCALTERAGVVWISSWGGPQAGLTAWVETAPNPLYGAPELTSAICAFYRATNTCGSCPPTQVCGAGGSCAPIPARRTDAVVTLSSAGQTQVFSAMSPSGDISGTVTLPGPAYAIDLRFADHRVTLGPTELPGPLAGTGGRLLGDYDHPTSLDVTWTPPGADTSVFTHIPINHHVGGATFTECAVPSSAGSMHVDEPMLVPLAVATGLEFQGVEHERVAAAHTPLGCIELRLYLHQFVSF